VAWYVADLTNCVHAVHATRHSKHFSSLYFSRYFSECRLAPLYSLILDKYRSLIFFPTEYRCRTSSDLYLGPAALIRPTWYQTWHGSIIRTLSRSSMQLTSLLDYDAARRGATVSSKWMLAKSEILTISDVAIQAHREMQSAFLFSSILDLPYSSTYRVNVVISVPSFFSRSIWYFLYTEPIADVPRLVKKIWTRALAPPVLPSESNIELILLILLFSSCFRIFRVLFTYRRAPARRSEYIKTIGTSRSVSRNKSIRNCRECFNTQREKERGIRLNNR